MECKVCGNDIKVPRFKCEVCDEDLVLIDSGVLDGILEEYKRIKNIVDQYSEYNRNENYRIRAVKNTKLEVYKEILFSLKAIIEKYSNIDLYNIEYTRERVEEPTMCQLNPRKICNHCLDC